MAVVWYGGDFSTGCSGCESVNLNSGTDPTASNVCNVFLHTHLYNDERFVYSGGKYARMGTMA